MGEPAISTKIFPLLVELVQGSFLRICAETLFLLESHPPMLLSRQSLLQQHDAVPKDPMPSLTTRDDKSLQNGVVYALAAYSVWGFFPLYFKALAGVSSWEVLAHRIIWSFATLSMILTATRRWKTFWQSALRPRVLLILSATTLLIAINWLVFIYAVSAGKVLQSSLGYFINPLVSAMFGVIFLRERLSVNQRTGFLFAAAGVLFLALRSPTFPWIALSLAVSFGAYGLLRKTAPIDALTGLAIETMLLAPAAALFLGILAANDQCAYLAGPPQITLLLSCSGLLTSLPLLWFAAAAKRLRLATLGLMQYLVPTLHFSLAVLHFREPLSTNYLISFALIWTGLLLYTTDTLRKHLSPGS